MPSRTNNGAMRSAVRTVVSATRSRSAAVERKRRGRSGTQPSTPSYGDVSSNAGRWRRAATIDSSVGLRRARRRRGRATRRPRPSAGRSSRSPTTTRRALRRALAARPTPRPRPSRWPARRRRRRSSAMLGVRWRRDRGVGLDGRPPVPGGRALERDDRRLGRPARRAPGRRRDLASRPSTVRLRRDEVDRVAGHLGQRPLSPARRPPAAPGAGGLRRRRRSPPRSPR